MLPSNRVFQDDTEYIIFVNVDFVTKKLEKCGLCKKKFLLSYFIIWLLPSNRVLKEDKEDISFVNVDFVWNKKNNTFTW